MFFTIRNTLQTPPGATNCAFLIPDGWDDWGKYKTVFHLDVIDEAGISHRIGQVKIGQIGLKPSNMVQPGYRSPEIPDSFDNLTEAFFSLGQGEDYYTALNQLNPKLQHQVLTGLRDCAFDLAIFEKNINELVMHESLLRSVQSNNVRNRLYRLAHGHSQLTRFDFSYVFPPTAGTVSPVMSFSVTPESHPPTNVHVLIGRNGAGKTRCMRLILEALLGRTNPDGSSPGTIALQNDENNQWSFAGIVLISFSAFDDFDLNPLATDNIGSVQVGLRHSSRDGETHAGRLKSPPELAVDFRVSLERCRQGLRAERWRAAVTTLEVDDLFAEANVSALLDVPDDISIDVWRRHTESIFRRMSSGHAIILLTITRLVELVDEKTLVLLDEPEGHLHPPLLAAFIRCLSDLLVKRNGVAIVSTHSPVVLQEVPQLCVWKLRRSRLVNVVERPTIQTFGENIGLLTREVFGLEVTRSGFHQLLEGAVATGLTYEEINGYFNNQIGAEARAIVKALIADRNAK